MKLIVMIPCYNEEKTLPLVLKTIPEKISGVDKVETLIVDDGCTDGTVEVAEKLGVDHIVHHKKNKGLAQAFATGLESCLGLGADIIVTTDGDNQYPQGEIPKLIKPILEGKAEMVIADRQTYKISEFSWFKKILQYLASATVRTISGTQVPDALSGFRAFTRNAALKLNVFTDYTYSIETVIQAGKKKIPLEFVKINTNRKTRDSRLIKSLWQYFKKSVATVARIYALYEPLKTFTYIGLGILSLGIMGGLRFLYFFLQGNGTGHVQSLLVSAVFSIVGFQVMVLGLMADLIGTSRKLLEDILFRIKRREFEEKEG